MSENQRYISPVIQTSVCTFLYLIEAQVLQLHISLFQTFLGMPLCVASPIGNITSEYTFIVVLHPSQYAIAHGMHMVAKLSLVTYPPDIVIVKPSSSHWLKMRNSW